MNGDVGPRARRALLMCKEIGIPKSNGKDIRPIAVGETLLR